MDCAPLRTEPFGAVCKMAVFEHQVEPMDVDHPPQSSGVAERLAPYDLPDLPGIDVESVVEHELVERAAMLVTVMPRPDRRTIEELLAPNDPDRGRIAVDTLVASGVASEDDAGHLRRVG